MEQFLQDCEISALEVTVEQDGAGPPKQRRLDRPFLFVGRGARNDIHIDDEQVSQRHAYLQAVGGRVFCVDLSSRTGVHWPAGPQAADWVQWNQPLRIGRAVVRVARPEANPRKTSLIRNQDGRIPPPGPAVVFEVSGPELTPVRWSMNRTLDLVGGASACKVRLRHGQVSRFHCSLVRGAQAVWAVDLLSREGIRLNGHRVAWARLAAGDRLEVGPFVLQVRYEQALIRRDAARAPSSRVGPPALATPQCAAPTALDQSLLLPVINEFNRMQQQMMEQFHQTMLMMAEMFSTLHREQAVLVREELGEVRRLTQELNALRAETARQALDAQPTEVVGAQAEPKAEAPPAATANVKTLESEIISAGSANSNGTTEKGPGATRPSSETAPTPANVGATPPPSREANQNPPPSGPTPDVHDWLSRRVAALQEERQGRWQKILQFITGGRSS
jgi:pSer/pThr/pTyr-binding forkhead associated (FHA) protein